MAVREIVFELRARADKLEGDFDKAKDKTKKLGDTLDKSANRRLSQFNEKSEKARQILTAMGGTMGGVAGQATYYAGTLGFMAERFTITEVAAVGLIGGLALLGYSLRDTEFAKEMLGTESRELRKEIDKQVIALDGLISKYADSIEGLSEAGRQFKRAGKSIAQLRKEQEKLLALEGKIRESTAYNPRAALANAKALSGVTKSLKDVNEQIDKLERKTGVTMIMGSLDAITKAARKAIVEAEREKDRSSARAKDKAAKGAQSEAEAEERRRLEIQREFARWRKMDTMQQTSERRAIIAQAEQAEAIGKEQSRQREIARNRAMLQIMSQDERRLVDMKIAMHADASNQMIGIAVNLMAALAENGLKGAMEYASAQLKGLAIEATWKALYALAEAYLFSATYQYKSAAEAKAAASHYAAVAVGAGAAAAVTGAVGGISGGGGGQGTGRVGAGSFGGSGVPESSSGGEPKEQKFTLYVAGPAYFGRDADQEIYKAAERGKSAMNPGLPQGKI